MVADSRLPNFRALTPAQRLAASADAAGLTPEERQQLAFFRRQVGGIGDGRQALGGGEGAEVRQA